MGPHAGGAVPGPPGAAPGCHVVAASAGFQGPPCWASLWLSSLPPACPEPAPRPSQSPISTCSVVSKSLLSTCAWPQKPSREGRGGQAGSPRRAPVPAEEAETKTSTGAEKRNGPRRGWARTLPPAGPRAGAEDRAPPRTGRRIGPRPGRPGGGGGGGSRRVAARGAGCSETPS